MPPLEGKATVPARPSSSSCKSWLLQKEEFAIRFALWNSVSSHMISLSPILPSWCHFYGNKAMGALIVGPDSLGHQSWSCALQTGLFISIQFILLAIVTKCTKDNLENSRKLKVQVPNDSFFFLTKLKSVPDCLPVNQSPVPAPHSGIPMLSPGGDCAAIFSPSTFLFGEHGLQPSPTPASTVGVTDSHHRFPIYTTSYFLLSALTASTFSQIF